MGGGAHGCRWWYVFLSFFNQKAVYRCRGSHQHPHLLPPPIAMHHQWWSIVLQPGFWAAYMPLPEQQLLPIKCYNNLLKSFGDRWLYLYGCVTGVTISSLEVFFLFQIQLRDVPFSSFFLHPIHRDTGVDLIVWLFFAQPLRRNLSPQGEGPQHPHAPSEASNNPCQSNTWRHGVQVLRAGAGRHNTGRTSLKDVYL